MPNIYTPDYDSDQELAPYSWRRARVATQAGAEKLGASVFDIPAGSTMFPMHGHLHNEELLIVLTGTPTLRGADGNERVLAEGEVVSFAAGPRGAHHVHNATETSIRLIVASTMLTPEVYLFPESDTVMIRDFVAQDVPPGGFNITADVRGGLG